MAKGRRETSVVAAIILILLLDASSSFVFDRSRKLLVYRTQTSVSSDKPSRFGSSSDDDRFDSKFGGYTAKQRLREEVEYPFRTFRLYLFGYSTVSAAVALYFSLLNTAKAAGSGDASLGQDALQSCAINVGALVVCGYLTYRDWQAGNTNLERISRGGALAKLRVVTASGGERRDLASYRRRSRLCLAVGSRKYLETLCRTICADQRADRNTFVEGLQEAEVVVVPILLESADRESSKLVVRDSAPIWEATESAPEDRNFDVRRADPIVAFPSLYQQYTEYLQPEIEACKTQGFDVYEKGFVLVVKKNGKILRRVTGQPPLQELIETLPLADINFGMPGDTEKYGN